jgi:hypothetical protein
LFALGACVALKNEFEAVRVVLPERAAGVRVVGPTFSTLKGPSLAR